MSVKTVFHKFNEIWPFKYKSKEKEGNFLQLISPFFFYLFIGLMVFPKPLIALEYSFTVSDPESYQGYIEDLRKFLKRKYVFLE